MIIPIALFIALVRARLPLQLPDDVSMETKKQRLAIVQERIQQNGRQITQEMIGTIQPVLITRHATKNPELKAGRTSNNRVVNFDGGPHQIGEVVNVLITEVLPSSLRGELA